VAWMRMMGADSVEYHEHTVAGRGDDPVAASGEYYASRGETPMSWGGSGRGLLGLAGEVDLADYRASSASVVRMTLAPAAVWWHACVRAWSSWFPPTSQWPNSA